MRRPCRSSGLRQPVCSLASTNTGYPCCLGSRWTPTKRIDYGAVGVHEDDVVEVARLIGREVVESTADPL